MAVLATGSAAKGDQKGGSAGKSNIFKIVKMVMERNFAPIIIFSFSKRECEVYAMQMAKLDFNTGIKLFCICVDKSTLFIVIRHLFIY